MPVIDTRTAGCVLALALAAGAAPVYPQPGVEVRGPTLLVTIVVDQMRADYLEGAQRRLHGGFGRLLRDGAVFDRAEYPYATTLTCPGHATIATGTFPATHGIVANDWWSRADNRRVVCTDDAGAASVAYVGAAEAASHSARRLRVPTLGDRLRAAHPDARVVALAMKPRSAVMLGGHAGTAVTWFVGRHSRLGHVERVQRPAATRGARLSLRTSDRARALDGVDADRRSLLRR